MILLPVLMSLEYSISLHLIAVALGILCLLLMMAIAVWLTYIFQYSEKNHNLQKTLNDLTQQYHTLQRSNSLMKEMLRNKSRELDDLKRQKELDSSSREQNRFCGETKVLDFIQFTGKYVKVQFFCCGIKCYFIMANKHWSGCKQTCQDCNFSLLKIDDDDELKFLQFKINPNSYWIGLLYNARKNKWQWIDDDPTSLDLMTVKSLQRSGGCAFLSYRGIHTDDCGRNYPCICEMRVDRNHSRSGFKAKHTLLTIKMSDEEITYATVRFGKSSELQTRGRHDETQGLRGTVHRECVVPRYLIAISLGILCSLLVAVTVLVAYVSQNSGNKHELQQTLNSLTQQYHTLQSNNSLMKEMLRNKSREFGDLKCQKELDSCNRELNRCCRESKVLDCIHLTGKYVDGYWLCSGIKCYFMMDNKHWSGCKQTCRDCSLSLLKIDDDDELKFLQVKLNPNTYWIGLSYDARKNKWQWIGEEPSNLDSKRANLSYQTGRCAFLSRTRLDNTKCEIRYPCICEMRMDKLPNLPSSKK
ncbi:hypothetical protein ACRRTK_006054 [Alexandromys fortis]